MAESVSLPSVFDDLTEEDRRRGIKVPLLMTPPPSDNEREVSGARTQVNLPRSVVELAKAWLQEGDRPGSVRDVFERALRMWLMIYADELPSLQPSPGKPPQLRFGDSATGQALKRVAERIDVPEEARMSRSVREALILRVGASIAVNLLQPGQNGPDLWHDLFEEAHRQQKPIGEVVADQLRLAAAVREVLPDADAERVQEALRRTITTRKGTSKS